MSSSRQRYSDLTQDIQVKNSVLTEVSQNALAAFLTPSPTHGPPRNAHRCAWPLLPPRHQPDQPWEQPCNVISGHTAPAQVLLLSYTTLQGAEEGWVRHIVPPARRKGSPGCFAGLHQQGPDGVQAELTEPQATGPL